MIARKHDQRPPSFGPLKVSIRTVPWRPLRR